MTAIQNNDHYIGQLLVRDGLITPADLERGLNEQKRAREFLCTTLVRLGLASEEKIFSILSLQIGIPFLSLKGVKIDPVILNRVPGSFALACKCVPLKIVDSCYYVAMSDPLNSEAVNEIKSYLGASELRIFLSGDNEIRDMIKTYYGT